jgi:DNA-binding Xre family transcriptional regulator
VNSLSYRWKLKQHLATKHQLYQLTDIRRVIEERTGVRWSVETISQLVNKRPRSLRVQTMQTLCDAFSCRLDDFCEILPDARPGFSELLNSGEQVTDASAASADGQIKESGRGRRVQRSRDAEGEVDLASFFPEARQFKDSP